MKIEITDNIINLQFSHSDFLGFQKVFVMRININIKI